MYSSFIFRRLHTTKGRLEDKITTPRRRIIDHTHIVQCVIFKVTAIPRLTLTHWFLLMDMQLLWEHSQHLIMLYWCSLFSAAVQQTNAWFFFPPLFSASFIPHLLSSHFSPLVRYVDDICGSDAEHFSLFIIAAPVWYDEFQMFGLILWWKLRV